MRSLQKFATLHGSIHHHFNLQDTLANRQGLPIYHTGQVAVPLRGLMTAGAGD